MKLFGFDIRRAKAVAEDIATRPQYTPTAAQGPLTPWFQDYHLRKVSGDFYEALREGIPVIDSAIRRLISLNGTVRVIGDNAALVRELEDFVLNVPVNDHQKGIHAFLECFCNEMFEQGFSLPEFVATAAMDDIAELRVPDSKQILFRRNAAGKTEPWYRHFSGFTPPGARYNSPGTLVERILTATYGQPVYLGSGWEEKLNPANKLYFSINNENTDPYGVSIMRSMEFCAKLLMTMQNSLGNVWERFGDPSYHVKYKTNKKDLGGDALETRRQKIQTDFSAAIRAKRGGKSADFVTALSTDAEMEIKVIGAEGQVLELEVPARHVLEQIVSKTNLPAWMLGIYWSTTERMATLEVEAALQDAKVRQLAMLPELIRLFSVFLRLRGRTWKSVTTSLDKPGDWGIVFETPNLRDMVAQAQARFLNAQADQMQSTAGEREAITVNAPKKSVGAKHASPACACGCKGAVHGAKELHRPEPWPELDAVETGYEDRLKSDWEDLRGRIYTIARLTDTDLAAGMRSAKGPEDAFTFAVEQRARALDALKDFIGEYATAAEGSPLVWYYGQAYSLGLIQAARMVGEARPILDLIKNKEIFDELARSGFELVKNGATKTIQNRILAEMEAHAIAGSNPMSVAARLKKLFGDQNASWERLARSEMSMAAEQAKEDEWKEWGVEKMDFVPAPDACPICAAMEGEYPIDQCPLPVRDTHPRCRCSRRPAASEA
jgi:SPP1 gp7 family putative phage head morphogenesis protein